MKLVTVLLLLIPCFAQLPNSQLTPGVVRTINRAEICSPAFRTGPFRHTTYAMKKQVCRAYGVAPCPRQDRMELDHLIPLELGGADEVANLWPEFAKYKDGPGFHVKDQLENELRRQVCAGGMSLPAAQTCIRANWIRCYQHIQH